MLSITREQFRQVYAGTKVLAQEEILYSDPKSDQDLVDNYLTSKLWRLNHLYTIVDKKGNKNIFKMRLAQHKVYAACLRHPRIIILKSRQQGISTLWLVSFFDDAITLDNFSIGLMAQGLDEAETLLSKIKVLWEELDDEIKEFLSVAIIKDNTKEIHFSNGAKMFVRTSFRSATLQRLHISEMGKIANKYPEKAKETKTGTLQAIAPGNIAVIESTAEGDNDFKKMWDSAYLYLGELSGKDFSPVFLPWIDDPDCVLDIPQIAEPEHIKYFDRLKEEDNIILTPEQQNFWVAQYRELGEDIFQEYPATPTEAFMKKREGTYFAHLYLQFVKKYNREVMGNLYEPRLPVQAAIDLGMDDTNVITLFQVYRGKEFRIIGEIFNNGHDIEYYCEELKKLPYYDNITHIILPHDSAVREQTSGMTREEAYQKFLPDVYITVAPRLAVGERIHMLRQVLKNMFIDVTNCPYLKNCLLNYHKAWNDKYGRYENHPEHDEYSNGADSMCYMAVGADLTDTFATKRVKLNYYTADGIDL